MKEKRRLGEILIGAEMLTQDRLTIALAEQKKTGELLGRIIVRLGFVPEPVMHALLSHILDQPGINLDQTTLDPRILKLVPRKLIERHDVIPVHWDRKSTTLTLAMADTQDMAVLDKIQANIHSDITLKTILAEHSAISRAIQRAYSTENVLEPILRELENSFQVLESLPPEQAGQFSPVMRLVEMLLTDGVQRGASEIHIEPEAGSLRLRYRIDGVLSEMRELHRDLTAGIVMRIKTLAGIDAPDVSARAEGRFSLKVASRMIDCRVFPQPVTHGDNLLVRLRDRNPEPLSLESLGLSRHTQSILMEMMAKPAGIILATGPKGSGKTTTLYAMLAFLNHEQRHIMTLEESLAYPMAMVRQQMIDGEKHPENISENIPEKHAEWASTFDSVLRQGSDILLLDEIRNPATARMVLRAAMTGHQVFSTVQATSALAAFQGLFALGIPGTTLAGNLTGIMGQRLVRRLCSHCKQPHQPDPREQRLLGLGPDDRATRIFVAAGCERCHGIGFKGQVAIMEALLIDDDGDLLIEQNQTRTAWLSLARNQGFIPMADEGIRRVLTGETSLDEIRRVLDLSRRMIG
ncbi:MAG: Flp pilus assembly complex ATPase component TadA [Magnetococcales bacterium]|nr:Flp pilus assembly complex ATPase component TadA [Magnetococcales bacterium]